ncbi:NACHT, LRR and PYD domains-containing protein 12-like [Myxocyprinus asiaticus]|uniref:NACHT, LRR and PYD domains-containing protein 12-like n=1 Tax=Myxocyprinus asiaticus TaxID=70543 RepID=UPI0022224BCE|nr:NACHT, LRR and PYD domains-containing protein 12-like [Myxocyprinus asiaticus]
MSKKASNVAPGTDESHSKMFPSRQVTKVTAQNTQTDHASLMSKTQMLLEEQHHNNTASKSLTQSVRSASPVSSCVSMKSKFSMGDPPNLQDEHTNTPQRSVLRKREGSLSPVPSCLSMKSHQSMDPPLTLKKKELPSEPMLEPTEAEHEDTSSPHCQMANEMLKLNLKEKCQCLYEGTAKQGNPTFLNEIYTELYITESESGGISNEHEVRHIETQSRSSATEDTPIKCNDIFKPLTGQDKPIRTVLTKGVAGIGKTVSVQKFILDWAEGKENQEVHLIFPLPFRELNLMNDKKLSLSNLLLFFFPETKEIEISSNKYKVAFIFDGLDECRLSLDFQSNMRLCDVSESASVDMLLTNLMKGNLLPSALIWITSRPAAADLIPSECVDRVTEVRGFNEPQKKEYFRKRISDQSLANRIITHLKSSRSLYIMCHIPVFCWISATVLERMLSEAESGEIPKTLTQMYTNFLIVQINIKHEKDYDKKVTDEEMILKLGKLAFEQLVRGNLIFYEEDLRECGIDVTDASVYSGLCTQIFREEFGLYQGKVFCFVHLTIQEHLAALYVHTSFSLGDTNILYHWKTSNIAPQFKFSTISDLHKSALDKMLQSKNGHFDLFLRFLLGLSLESNQALLRCVISKTSTIASESVTDTIDYIKIRLRMNLSPEKYINLFHCLNELNDFSLEEEIQSFQKSRRLSKTKLTASQWSALVFVLLSSESCLDVFDLRKYSENNADECLERMLPVVKSARTAEVRHCNLTSRGFQALNSAFSSKSTNLKHLKLSGNTLHGSGMQILSHGLQNSHCKLETLELSECGINPRDCTLLSEALNSNPSNLRELDLSFSFAGDTGVTALSSLLKNPQCALQKLKLLSCRIEGQSCKPLADALSRNTTLMELDLNKNDLQDSGIKLLSAGLKNPNCKLTTLSLEDCNITVTGCRFLCSALSTNPHLTELRLNMNKIQDSGAKIISDLLKNPECKLERLRLSYCDITERGGAAMASALQFNPSHLRELDLSGNKLGEAKKRLTALQEHSNYRLDKLMIDR